MRMWISELEKELDGHVKNYDETDASIEELEVELVDVEEQYR